MTGLDQALDRAYRRTVYRVELDDGPLDLFIGVANPRLARLLASFGMRTAAFLTACNPGSKRLDAAANQAAQAALLDSGARLGCIGLPGVAVDPDGQWPDEESLLLLGVDAAAATALARRFGQNALVWIGNSGIPELVWVRTPGRS